MNNLSGYHRSERCDRGGGAAGRVKEVPRHVKQLRADSTASRSVTSWAVIS